MQKSNKLNFNFLEHNPYSAVVCDIPGVNCSCKLGFRLLRLRFRQQIRIKICRPITFEICGEKHLHTCIFVRSRATVQVNYYVYSVRKFAKETIV